MLKKIPNNIIYSRITVNRMRYRGPMESYKINKFKADVYKDLTVLKEKFDIVHERLNQYVSDTISGIDTPIVVKQGEEILYNDIEKEKIELINHKITISLTEED